jgi:hypothetical protein
MKEGFHINATVGSKSTFRKGISGDWVNHFTEKHLDFVNQELKTELIEFGFIKND